MLQSLHIRNYILINSLDIDFPKGLIIITGQTGAGKSILLGALNLLSGAKADASMLSQGADNCVVEAEYNEISPEIKSILDEEDIESNSDSLIIRRQIAASGRSRCFVNDCPVSLPILQKLSNQLIDIHSQHSSLLLGDKAFQLSVLDNYADCTKPLMESRRLWKELQAAKNELVKLKDTLRKIASERDYDAAQLKELEAAKLGSEDELESLDKEQKSLANAEEIKSNLQSVISLFTPSDDNSLGLNQALKESIKNLNHISKYLPDSLPNLVERLESVRLEINDIEDEVSTLDSVVDISPDKLQSVEDRMSLLYSLMKKHYCSNLKELMEYRDSLKAKLIDSSSLEEKIEETENQIDTLQKQWQAQAQTLHDKRSEFAPQLSEAITKDLNYLELENSVFKIEISESAPNADGFDSIQYLFSANGDSAKDVSKVASGGELSRIMLSLKATMAKYMRMPTMIFDEIDTGVSGSVADKMGSMICTMGQNMQVLSITHLPQVAAKGNAHYLVSKNKNISTLTRLQGEERILEIARLLSGSSISPEAIANAKSLLSEAN